MFDGDKMTRIFLKMREARRKLKSDYEAADKVIADQQMRVEAAMLGFLNDHKIDSAPTSHGVFFKQLDVIPQAADWDKFYNWIVETNGFDFLARRIKKTAVQDYMNTNKGALPPGVNVFSRYVVRVRRNAEDGGDAEGDEA